MDLKQDLLSKIKTRQARVGVIGLGYVGLPLLLEFAEAGFPVLGFDNDKNKILSLSKGESYIKHISSERIANATNSSNFQVTDDFSRLPEADAVIICVPTPLGDHREPDLSYVEETAKTIQKYLRRGQLISLESTTYPGTTEEILLPLFESAPIKQNDTSTHEQNHSQKYVAGVDFFLVFSPEREDPNNGTFTTRNIPKVVGGVTPACLEVAQSLYGAVIKTVVPVRSPRIAEATKILENTFRAVNIALVNELKVAFMKMGIDIWEVIEAAKTKPFGFMPFYPGPGLGGHCIPIDPFYLTWKAREYGLSTRFIELAGEINTSMPEFVVNRVAEALNLAGKTVKGSKILVLGLAYKGNVDDYRESPSFHLIKKLEILGATVEYNDPFIPEIGRTREFPEYEGKKSVPITDDYDLILVATPHDAYRSLDFSKFTCQIVDTRNVVNHSTNVIKA